MSEINEIIKIADIHQKRIQMAVDGLQYYLPFTADKITTLAEREILLTELLVARFGKLQDLLGNKIINTFLMLQEEYSDNLTMLDKINKLERLGIVENAQDWKQMRSIRNHVAHEYPDNPELTAGYLNEIVRLTPKLLTILENLKIKLIAR